MDHADEQVLLAGVGKELYVAFSAAMADHDKTGNLIGFPLFGHHFDEPPVHLVGFAGSGLVPSAAVSLRGNHLTFGGDKILVGGDVIFYDRFPSLEPVFLQPVKNDGGIRNALSKQGINNTGKTSEKSYGRMPPSKTMWLDDKPVLLNQSKLGTAYTSAPADFREVDLIDVELVTKFFFHLV